ncbi:hypothetical protein E1B28_005235 [Marasmius oreades]|uniref:Rhodanese domain-containing protein n=1 Tax=Marasmius oreades TaxID=181124 RepID=A0A9P7V0B0_9AGAR|nr:uncharacterized protein E1B28_005235 [Marasmius oreades]KAG7097924.1 hypothetical protein E1B28_005235 [Marasmius oreades]
MRRGRGHGPGSPGGRLFSTTKQDAGEVVATSQSQGEGGNVKIITYDLLKPKTQIPNPTTIIIDVREPTEVRNGMIPTAVNIPLTTLHDSLKYSSEEFKKLYGVSKPERNQEITFYCYKGLRSRVASDIAVMNGFTK